MTLAEEEKKGKAGRPLDCDERSALPSTGMKVRFTYLPNILRFQETKYYCRRGSKACFYKGFTFWKELPGGALIRQ